MASNAKLSALMWIVLQLAYGLTLIALLLAAHALALYAIWWGVMMVVRFVPMIGRKGRHADWDRLNGRAGERVSR